jgi:glutamate decarboxylase
MNSRVSVWPAIDWDGGSVAQDRCVNMVARLFNAPIDEGEQAIGAGTVGSSEAIMLAGLAFKRKWQNERKAAGLPWDKPNMVTGANVQVPYGLISKHFCCWGQFISPGSLILSLIFQVCWEKFARYFEVELREVKLKEDYYIMDPAQAVELCDENTICVCAILGSTYNGEFEDVQLLNELLEKKNAEKGYVQTSCQTYTPYLILISKPLVRGLPILQ